MLRIDLHLHSFFSDGLLPPARLAELLKTRKISVASLTDHDTLDGQSLFLKACQRHGIRAVTGVELSASCDGELHILGYRMNVESEGLLSLLKKNRTERYQRNIEICEHLRAVGIDIVLEEAAVIAGSDVVGRPHIARVLVNKGYAQNLKFAFNQYLGQGALAYVPRFLPTAEECIMQIREAGGLPVLAHPSHTASTTEDLTPILRSLKDAGLWGLECFFAGCSPRESYRYLSLAQEWGLYATAGSDFHDLSRSPGVAVMDDFLPWAWFCGGL